MQLLMYTLEDLEKIVGEALRFARDGEVLSLAESPLAECSLVEHWFVAAQPHSSDERGRAVQAMLWWLIERLRPDSEQAWLATRWRSYNVLAGFYREGLKIADLAERMAVAEQTIYPIRNQALTTITKMLREELSHAHVHPNFAFVALYPTLTVTQQTLLRMLGLVDDALQTHVLVALAHAEQLEHVEAALHELARGELVHTTPEQTSYSIQPKIRNDVRSVMTLAERTRWHRIIGTSFVASDPLQAAIHWRRANDYEAAAHLLIDHAQTIIDRLQGLELAHVLHQFQPHELDTTPWMRLKLVCGDVAMTMNDVETALTEYQHALAANDVLTKAEAYFKRGKASRSRNTDEAIAHFAYSIQLLEQQPEQNPLLFRVYLEQAWMWFQDRHDQEQAQASLDRAQQLIDPDQRSAWAELFNARGQFASQQGDYQQAIQFHQQGWLAANEVQDTLLMTHLAHNLGNDYLGLRDYVQALNYFQQSLDLATKTGNRRMNGLCQKSIGACCFWLGEYHLAIEHYLQAYSIFAAMHNQNWQANTCYDLAEAYAELGDTAAMRRYFDEAVTLAHNAHLDRLLADLQQLAQQYAGLYPPTTPLNPRQQQIFDYLKHHPSITNRDYREIANISPKQAARDLNELVDAGVLTRVGDGRSTRYTLE